MEQIHVLISDLFESSQKNASLNEIEAKVEKLKKSIIKKKKEICLDRIREAKINSKRVRGEVLIRRDHDTDKNVTLTYKCYVCKIKYTKMHHFYHSLCPKCADFNYQKRFQTFDLSGKVAIVTGGRIKVGYETCLKLLRANCTVVCTTRFPTDAFRRYNSESDYNDFKERLTIWPLDLLDIEAIERFVLFFKSNYTQLDILINNAAQTIFRPDEYYETLIKGHTKTIFSENFPDMIDENGLQIDCRSKNTWVTRLVETEESELLGTILINYVAPFLLAKYLKICMNTSCSFIINVSSVEGKYTSTDAAKTDRHVHNNCAKAALNMITRSVACRWKLENIYVNSVETGWITDEMPQDDNKKIFYPPLDEIDGASRILDPIFTGLIKKDFVYGLFLKDYYRTAW